VILLSSSKLGFLLGNLSGGGRDCDRGGRIKSSAKRSNEVRRVEETRTHQQLEREQV